MSSYIHHQALYLLSLLLGNRARRERTLSWLCMLSPWVLLQYMIYIQRSTSLLISSVFQAFYEHFDMFVFPTAPFQQNGGSNGRVTTIQIIWDEWFLAWSLQGNQLQPYTNPKKGSVFSHLMHCIKIISIIFVMPCQMKKECKWEDIACVMRWGHVWCINIYCKVFSWNS